MKTVLPVLSFMAVVVSVEMWNGDQSLSPGPDSQELRDEVLGLVNQSVMHAVSSARRVGGGGGNGKELEVPDPDGTDMERPRKHT